MGREREVRRRAEGSPAGGLVERCRPTRQPLLPSTTKDRAPRAVTQQLAPYMAPKGQPS